MATIRPFPSSFSALTARTTSRRSRLVFCCSCSATGDKALTVAITGATGFVGRRLVQKLLSDDHKVCVLTRSATKAASVFPSSAYPGVTVAEQGDWEQCIKSSNAVVNLAGMPISTRWSPEVKREIMQSRVNVTSKLGCGSHQQCQR
ncbi:hypothetical protein ACQ4PT_033343 [Festuca glaucescens]